MSQAVRPSRPWLIYSLQALLIMGALALSLWRMHADPPFGDTVCSRLATVFSLVHDGRWNIDRPLEEAPNLFEQNTIDKFELEGHIYSTKPPLLPLLMTAEYAVLHHAFGYDLLKREDRRLCLQLMTLSLVGIPFLLGLIFFARLLNGMLGATLPTLLPLAALAFGSHLVGYAAIFNNHVPAAGMLIVALYYAVGLCKGFLAPKAWRFFLFGLSASLVFCCDLPMTIFVAVAGLFLLYRFPKQSILWCGLGMAGPLGLHFGVMIYVSGSLLPVQMHYDLYLFEGSLWRNPTGIDGLNEPKALYLFHMTLGRFGLFSLFPITLLAFSSLYLMLRQKTPGWTPGLLAGAFCLLVLTTYYVTSTNSYGGSSYGFRWYLGAQPVLLAMGALSLPQLRRWWLYIPVLALLAVSIYSAWECAQHPWETNIEWTCRYLFGPAL